MGYYTSFTLFFKGVKNKEQLESIIANLEPLDIFDPNPWQHDDFYQFYCNDIYKWYNYKEDMEEISLMFPTCAFQLYGDGEEDDDFWVCYFLNGKSEYCQGYKSYNSPTIIDWDHYVAPELKEQVEDTSSWNDAFNAPKDG